MPGPDGGGDPRRRDDGLGWVCRALFPDERLHLSLGGRGPADAGLRVVDRYLLVGTAAAPRFLLPMAPRRVVAAALLAYNALRPPKVRLARAAIGAAARVGVLDLARFPVLTIAASDPAAAKASLIGHVTALVGGGGRLYAACGIRPPDPNRKPTLQLFDATGRPRGYAKVGWNAATRELVRTEVAALTALAGERPSDDHPAVPRLLAHDEWDDRVVAVVEPLPSRVRGVAGNDSPRVAARAAVARRGGPPTPRRRLAGSIFADRLTREAAAAAGDDPRAPGLVDRLVRAYGDVEVEFGRWHGDWVPWNLGLHRGELIAWDWEHSAADVPVGFDLAHDAFQRRLVWAGRPAVEAAAEVDAGLASHGPVFGLGAAQRRLVADAYLMEMWLRTRRLAAGGAGWNPALHPALLDIVEKRLSG
jgi:hypothetical protein